jgi:solute carrier family 35 (adenosine 3'-phospho 5'-phosphosulfate transporter), member B2
MSAAEPPTPLAPASGAASALGGPPAKLLPPPPLTPQPPPLPRTALLDAALPSRSVALCSAAIIASLMLYALLQERIMTRPYVAARGRDGNTVDDSGELFRSTLLLVLANRVAAAAAAAAVIVGRRDWADLRNAAPLYTYVLISFSNVVATGCQYEALKWVTLPTQTLAKSAKMIPVLILGTTLSGKRYTVVDYAAAVAVALGCTAFMVFGKIAARKASESDSYIGLILMAAYLVFDGFTSTFQEKLFHGYNMSIYNAMLYINLSSAAMSCVLLTASGTLEQSLAFVRRYPQVLRDMVILSTSAVSGQFAITYTIKSHGALLYATVMTIRQFCTVFLSNIVFGHGMNIMQWVGAAVVFLALFYRSWAKRYQPKRATKDEEGAEARAKDEEAEPLRPSTK